MQLKGIAAAVLFVIACLLAGGIGSIFTSPEIPTWYAALNKPDFSPPNWVFAPVWTTLYILMGVAAHLVYEKGAKNKAEVDAALALFTTQLALNMAWSFLFFGLHSPLYGLIGIVTLWLVIALTMVRFYGISRPAGLLLVPYILWVSFASVLNLFVWMLNP